MQESPDVHYQLEVLSTCGMSWEAPKITWLGLAPLLQGSCFRRSLLSLSFPSPPHRTEDDYQKTRHKCIQSVGAVSENSQSWTPRYMMSEKCDASPFGLEDKASELPTSPINQSHSSLRCPCNNNRTPDHSTFRHNLMFYHARGKESNRLERTWHCILISVQWLYQAAHRAANFINHTLPAKP